MQTGGCKAQEGLGNGHKLPTRHRVLFWNAGKCFRTRQRWQLHNIVNRLIATELFTLKESIKNKTVNFMLCELHCIFKS